MTEIQPRTRTHSEFLNWPISVSLLVMINSGSIENGRAKAKKTWEFSISMFNEACWSMVDSCAVIATQTKTGITDKSRVIRRRAHSGIFMWTNPSMMT